MRSVLAVLAGYAVMVVLIGLKFVSLQQFMPQAFTDLRGLLFIVGTDALSAAAGGYVLALIAARRPIAHAIGLALVLVPLGIVNALANAGQEPAWFQIATITSLAMALPVGAWLRTTRQGAVAAAR
jgi:hypothetical protein